MFEKGKAYRIEMLELGRVGQFNVIVESVDMPLIKAYRDGKELIINTASSAFVKAWPVEEIG
jgi:hypothetical protein